MLNFRENVSRSKLKTLSKLKKGKKNKNFL